MSATAVALIAQGWRVAGHTCSASGRMIILELRVDGVGRMVRYEPEVAA